jgi:aspartyl/asparaginyl beta-hydroxylase (cupin superfamily)
LESASIIRRHTGPENRDGEFIRIHIPLIVPDGAIFFEVGGEVVYWNDIFGFDNQTIHSAHNYTKHRRLVYLIDIRRSTIGMSEGRAFDQVRDEQSYPPFDPRPYLKAA